MHLDGLISYKQLILNLETSLEFWTVLDVFIRSRVVPW
jgi:hypothetical protein